MSDYFMILFLKKSLSKVYYSECILRTVCGVFEFGVFNGKQDKFFRKGIK